MPPQPTGVCRLSRSVRHNGDRALRVRFPSFGAAIGAEVTGDALRRLALCPLRALQSYVSTSTRAERGAAPVDGTLEALDGVAAHDAASSAVAKSMLSRMIGDVAAYAADANGTLEGHMTGVGEVELKDFFTGGGTWVAQGLRSTTTVRGMVPAKMPTKVVIALLRMLSTSASSPVGTNRKCCATR